MGIPKSWTMVCILKRSPLNRLTQNIPQYISLSNVVTSWFQRFIQCSSTACGSHELVIGPMNRPWMYGEIDNMDPLQAVHIIKWSKVGLKLYWDQIYWSDPFYSYAILPLPPMYNYARCIGRALNYSSDNLYFIHGMTLDDSLHAAFNITKGRRIRDTHSVLSNSSSVSPVSMRHPITVTPWWSRCRHKSPVSRLFTQPFVWVHINENVKAPRHWPLWGEFTGDRWIPRTKGQ